MKYNLQIQPPQSAAMNRGSRRRHECRTFTRVKPAERAACCWPVSRTAVLIAMVWTATCLSADARPQTGNRIFSHAGQECQCIPFWECADDKVLAVPSRGSDITNPCTGGNLCCILAKRKRSVLLTANNNVKCGYGTAETSVIPKVINGNDALYGEFPWMAVIYKVKTTSSPASDQENTYVCGASLIHPQIALTAAQCVIKNNPNELKVYAGGWDLSNNNEPHPIQKAQVLKVIIHENYFGSNRPTMIHNDIALVYVTPAFLLTENVGILCLPPQDFVFQTNKCVASGWGKSKISKEDLLQSTLKRIELPIVQSDNCQTQLRQALKNPNFELHESFLCAGGEIGKDTCQGDGGRPLMCPTPNDSKQFHQAGIVSWGYGCGGGSPGVYTDVSKFRNWIDQKMIDLGLNTTYYQSDNQISISNQTSISNLIEPMARSS